jgi:hypothetical protein
MKLGSYVIQFANQPSSQDAVHRAFIQSFLKQQQQQQQLFDEQRHMQMLQQADRSVRFTDDLDIRFISLFLVLFKTY